ncbi:MAG: hypothetical protein M1355_01915 [Patescibacteria group bacterium]|nr:hypothetical protein [Patescibacteria group bacterium]
MNRRDKICASFWGKALKWFSLTVLFFSLTAVLFLYNLKTVINEKNIKEVGVKTISDLLEQNSKVIDENFDELMRFAEETPNETLKIPTGIENLFVEIKGQDIKGISKEDFYKKVPVMVVDTIYSKTLNQFINSNLKSNSLIPDFISDQLLKHNGERGELTNWLFTIFLVILAVSVSLYFFLAKEKKSIVIVGLVMSLVSFPIYICIYLFTPFINSTIRQTSFYVTASMITNLLNQVQRNYLYVFILGILISVVGFMFYLGFNLKNLFQKKKEYEKIIKV